MDEEQNIRIEKLKEKFGKSSMIDILEIIVDLEKRVEALEEK